MMEKTGTIYSRFKQLHERRMGSLFLKLVALGLGSVLVFEIAFFAWNWPDWEALRLGNVPASAVIEDYEKDQKSDPKLSPLRWVPVTRPFPKSVKKVFVLAEDSRFYEHEGVDVQAILEAIDYNYRQGRVLLGASTISQQTAKNMFLSLSRNPLRKWHELLFTFLLETHLSKDQILHTYLNIAEFGPGVFGLEAAAKHYYKSSAQALSVEQAVELAASLPSPRKHNPRLRTATFRKRVQRIGQTMQVVDRVAADGSKSQSKQRELEKSLEELRRELKVNPLEPVPAGEAPQAVEQPAIDVPVAPEAGGPVELEAKPEAEPLEELSKPEPDREGEAEEVAPIQNEEISP